jgi:hypothetical protein
MMILNVTKNEAELVAFALEQHVITIEVDGFQISTLLHHGETLESHLEDTTTLLGKIRQQIKEWDK